jgi:hypothetical protein
MTGARIVSPTLIMASSSWATTLSRVNRGLVTPRQATTASTPHKTAVRIMGHISARGLEKCLCRLLDFRSHRGDGLVSGHAERSVYKGITGLGGPVTRRQPLFTGKASPCGRGIRNEVANISGLVRMSCKCPLFRTTVAGMPADIASFVHQWATKEFKNHVMFLRLPTLILRPIIKFLLCIIVVYSFLSQLVACSGQHAVVKGCVR